MWISETGYSTFGEGEEKKKRMEQQAKYFEEICQISADKIFWYSALDQKKDTPTDDRINLKEESKNTAYHFGLKDSENNPKLLFFHWKGKANKGR